MSPTATLSPLQTLILWAIIARGGSASQKGLRPDLGKPDRDALVGLRLITTRKGMRGAIEVEVTDQGWAWASGHAAAPLPSRSTNGVAVLGDLLSRLDAYLSASDVTLADFIRPPMRRPADATSSPDPAALADRIRAAFLAETGGRFSRRARLAGVRAHLPDVPRPAVDAALRQLVLDRAGVLVPFDDPSELRPEDPPAAIEIGGEPRHLLILDR